MLNIKWKYIITANMFCFLINLSSQSHKRSNVGNESDSEFMLRGHAVKY